MNGMACFVETIKVFNGVFCNLEYHERRAQATAVAFFGKPLVWSVDRVVIPENMRFGLVKCRVEYDAEIRTISFQPYVMRTIRSLKLVNGDGVDYRYKSTDRTALARLLEQREACDDVLIVREGRITGTSFTNVVFEDSSGDFYTPDTCLLEGTCRRSLLDAKKIQSCPIRVEDVSKFQRVLLINAMIGLEDRLCVPVENIVL